MQTSTAEQRHGDQEQDLAAQARDGDRRAMSTLYNRYQTVLLRHAWRMLGDEASAVDVVQESYARAIAAMPRTRPGRLRFRPWIFRIATNLCLRELTRRTRCTPRELNDETLAGPPPGGEGASPEGARRRQELGPMVQRALDGMSERYRQILVLRELDGLSYEELAEVLEINRATVKVTLHRARARFAARLLAEQLLANPHVAVGCGPLRDLLVEGDRRGIERHLERCDDCRRPERRPARELFALLPPVPALSAPLPELGQVAGAAAKGGSMGAGSMGASTMGAAAGGASVTGAGLSVGAWVGGGAVACAVVVVAAVTTIGPRPVVGALRVDSPQPGVSRSGAARVATTRAITRAPTKASALASPSATSAAGTSPVATPPEGRQGRGGVSTKNTNKTKKVAPTRPRATPRRDRPTGPVAQAADAEQPPGAADGGGERSSRKRARPPIGLKLRPGTAWLTRGGKRLAVTAETRLARGDRLVTRNGSLALLLPGHQWLTLRGALALGTLPTSKSDRRRVEVTLGRGVLRLSANRRGGGLLVRHGGRTCRVDHGEARLVTAPGGALRVEAIDGYVHVRGPHASRTVTPGAGVELARRPGFARALLSAPRRLRPTSHRGHRAPELRWRPVAGAQGYRVLVARDADFLLPEERVTVDAARYRPRVSVSGKHFWKVVPLSDRGQGAPSKVYSFDLTGR